MSALIEVRVGDRSGKTEYSETARDLLGYLVENPDAQDTLDGIVEWWLLERKIDRGIATVNETLKLMSERGLITERKGADGRIRYSINAERQDEIAALLNEQENS